ncbi:MAG: glycoside hydrolase family 97 catalytic domain-containing protein [Bacteroidales bacterium]|nr:glycoside hydrolase family 97 catalytic domain-containing protein [Bacteroidales bacterium]
MKRLHTFGIITTFIVSILAMTSCGEKNYICTSPDNNIALFADSGKYVITYKNQKIFAVEKFGYDGCAAPNFNFVKSITDEYTMLSGKRSKCENLGSEYSAALSPNVDLILRVYNNGIAFRYRLHGMDGAEIPAEKTAYRIPEGVNRWMQQWCDSYEGFFPLATTAKQQPVPSYSGINKSADGFNCRWGYPALIEPVKDVFVLLSEADVAANNSASSLWNDKNLETYEVRPDKNEQKISGDYLTPWRVTIIGQLADIVESTLITDLATPSKLTDVSWIQPGVVSWIYWAYNHGSNDYEIIKKYVDLAVALKLPYVLIDAEWDTMKDGKTIEDAVKYALDNNIKPLIWYNSSVGWVDGAPTPKFRLNKPEDREKEFAWLEKIGVAGVKIDFFSGDNQMNMSYCIDLLESAAKHHLTVNFHGATIPRGWQRTYPNLLSTEGVYGAEWYNNVPTFTDKAACHNATLPFTRNVIGPMDYTPCAFSDSQHPHNTTNPHELALTVLFESGLQHIADRPESLLAKPQEVKDFFSELPAAWDETKFVCGYPSEYVVLARRKGTTWYIAGINGTNEVKSIDVNLDFIDQFANVQGFFESADGKGWTISNRAYRPASFTFAPRGGFVVVVKK